MAVDAHPAVRIGLALEGVELVLPEAAAEHGRLAVVHHAHAYAAQLSVSAAGHHGSPLPQPRIGGSPGTDLAHHVAALDDRWENIVLQADLAHDLRVPRALLQIENAGGAAVAGLGLENARQLVNQPVVEHAHRPDLSVQVGPLVLDPQNAGQRAQRVGLAGLAVDFFFQLRVHPDQLSHLVVASGVHVGAGPDLPAGFVVKHNALAHTGGADRRDLAGIDLGLGNHAADALAGQLPVVNPVKIHAAGVARILAVGPFALYAAELSAVRPEHHRAHTAGSRVHCHQVLVCHKPFPSVSKFVPLEVRIVFRRFRSRRFPCPAAAGPFGRP